ncbi:hypothetical protein HZQ11_13685 [Elizabethkingia anophelis]|uniref:HNH endonuclease 5 domain-containing protein n=1 Tax=Elizabethkingia anophelis TaxID=1117645 RepID=A0A455ZDX6_9FLAO|nr:MULTISPECIES: hypothetical protein [Elizabethkingia]KUF46141.1 hypothetical protein AS358_10475 [Elizabethkingia anophelis]MCT3644204.1 hypothetical protein [Elizabethkingia anophelis]MCT3650537.1 hypothetical protein [Elizabethkingia anophelis]MCT3656429.1 hypothetical protein [Elizabethkingia anophelis]MCT3657975.1 hypothetical protein [Elizabethkingia anophelis]
MSNNIESRKRLFDKFSSQLHLLRDEGLLNIDLKFERTYICPICLRQFEESDLISTVDKNFLTEEDAPPAKLDGQRVALTCFECNSTAGHQIDVHLINRIKYIDRSKFYKGSKQEGFFEYEGKRIMAEITSNGDGTLEILHKTKNNNPTLLDKFMYGIKNKDIGPLLNLQPKRTNDNSDRVNLALLKTNYIITFSKFGYIFLLDKHYDNIREQIRDVNKGFDRQIFLKDQFSNNKIGTYYVFNDDAKSIFNIFSLRTEYSETLIGAILPLPEKTPDEIYKSLVTNGFSTEKSGETDVTLNTRNYDPDADVFSDMKEIMKIVNWIKTP